MNIRTNEDQPFLDPYRAFQSYAHKHGINIEIEMNYEQVKFLFLRLVDDYLTRKIPLGDFMQFVMELDGYRFEDVDPRPEGSVFHRKSNTEVFLPLDEIIMYISDVSSYQEILKHEPTLELVKNTELTPDGYSYDWPMREALRFYKKYRKLLGNSVFSE